GMAVDVPFHVLRDGFVNRIGDVRERAGDVMLEATFAVVAWHRLELRNPDDARAAERLQRVLREFTLSDVATNPSRAVVGRETREGHRSRLHFSHAGAAGVLATDRPGDDRLVVHLGVVEKRLRQVAAVAGERPLPGVARASV